MAGSGLVRMKGGDHSLFMAGSGLVRMKGGAFIIYSRGWAGKNEGEGGQPIEG